MAILARDSGYKDIIIPVSNAQEAAVLNTIAVRPVNHLSEAVEFLNGRSDLPVFKTDLDSMGCRDPG